MLKMKRTLLLGLLILMFLPLYAQPRCAVLDFQIGTGVTEEEIDGLTYNFRANFSVNGYRIIPKEIMYGAIGRLGFNRTDMTMQQTLKLSRELEAKLVVVGTMNKFMDEYSVDIRALDVASGITCATEGATFEKRDYRTAMETLAAKLGEKLGNNGLADSRADASSGVRPSQPSGPRVGYADLGLSVKWATCNFGADKPEEYGDYYAWGEIVTKMTYDWSVYKWCNGTQESLTKYNTNSSYGRVDNKAVLDAADDVATAKLGGRWRMPTDAEWTELRNKCIWTWTTQNGVNGYRVTSKINGNSIFLPAAGGRFGADLSDAGSYGRYWSSSLNTGSPNNAWRVSFYSDGVFGNYVNRYYGQSVRPVTE